MTKDHEWPVVGAKPDDGSGLSPYSQQDGMLGADPMDVSPRGGPGLFPTPVWVGPPPAVSPRSPVLTAASVAHDVQRELYGQRDAAVALVERYARQEVLKALANAGTPGLQDEVAQLKREIEGWRIGSQVEAAEADRGRAEVAKLRRILRELTEYLFSE